VPSQPPPKHYVGSPRRHTLSAGIVLSRVHSVEFAAVDFNPTLAHHPLKGGRFDATQADKYSYLYAASDDDAAVVEALLRDVASDERGARLLPAKAMERRRISWVRPTTDLELVSLRTGKDLAAVAQDTWLIQTTNYGETRPWGHAIRAWAPWAEGFAWTSRLEPQGTAYVLFGDRCPSGVLESVVGGTPIDVTDNYLDKGEGEAYVRRILAEYRVTLYP